MSVRPRVTVGSTLVLTLAALAPASPAAAASLECGDTVTASTVLTQDLACGAGDGLVIGADDVVLDLGGHTIAGAPGSSAGVRSARHARVTISNGTVTGFAQGVVLDESTEHVVTELTLRRNDRGIDLAGGGGHFVEKNDVAASSRDGIRLGLSAGNVVTKNVLTDNEWGVSVADGSAANLVAKNVAAGSRANGVAVFGGATDTVVEKNEVSSSWGHGILVTSDTSGTVLVKNFAADNGADGVHVDAAGATLTKNTAVHNAGYGIFAVPGATDGGGNDASGNAGPAQCSGVHCDPAS